MKTSDHKMLITHIDVDMKPIVREPKEMFFSGQVNDPKMEQLQHYLKYNILLWKAVTENKLNKEKFEEL